MGKDGWLLKQWVATILLGAANIEQSKLLYFDDLRRFLGQTLRSTHEQRVELTRLATPETVESPLRLNAQEVNAPRMKHNHILYGIDPLSWDLCDVGVSGTVDDDLSVGNGGDLCKTHE